MKIFNFTLSSGKNTAWMVAAIALIGTGQLNAQTVVSNLNAGSGALVTVGSGSGGNRSFVFSFTTGATAASFDFTGATLNFIDAGGSPTGLALGLYDEFTYSSVNHTGTLGTLLTTLSLNSGTPTTAGNSTFLGSTTLVASTTYYLSVTADLQGSSSEFYYRLPLWDNTNQTGLSDWVIGGSYISMGSYWDASGAPQFSIQATAVPEPSTYAVFAGLGVLGFAAWRRRKSIAAQRVA